MAPRASGRGARSLAVLAACAAALMTAPAPLSAQQTLTPAMQQAVSALTRALQQKNFEVLAPYLDDGFRVSGMTGPFARQLLAQVVAGGRRAPTAVHVESSRAEGGLVRVDARFAYPEGERPMELVLTAAGKFVEIPLVQVQMTGGAPPGGGSGEEPVHVVMGGAPPPGVVRMPAGTAPVQPGTAPAPADGDRSVTNPALRDELLRMMEEDQRVRSALTTGGTPPSPGSPAVRGMLHADSIHTGRLREIVERHGWPGSTMVGEDGAEAAWTILQHSDQETQERYLPLVRQAVERHELGADMLAMLEDRVRMRRGEKQLYGTQLRRDPATGRAQLWPVEDEANVDRRRAAVGLPPLAMYLSNFGIQYTPPAPSPRP
ncbi:MAG TPA: DUF6624 domain-containing protein [Longimicrobium sp.]